MHRLWVQGIKHRTRGALGQPCACARLARRLADTVCDNSSDVQSCGWTAECGVASCTSKCVPFRKPHHDDFGVLFEVKGMLAMRCQMMSMMVHGLGANGGLVPSRKVLGSVSDQVQPSNVMSGEYSTCRHQMVLQREKGLSGICRRPTEQLFKTWSHCTRPQ